MKQVHSRMEERDVDLLLLEELAVSDEFRSWFLDAAGISGPSVLITAARSVHTANGESDIELVLEHAGEVIQVLIENKIGAVFQPRQAERYVERGAWRIDNRECTSCVIVLTAPQEYLDRASAHPDAAHFGARVSYEAIADWLAAQNTTRGRVRAELLRQAFENRVNGRAYDATATDFHTLYWKSQQDIAPRLGLKKPDVRGPSSSFVVFQPDALQEARRRGLCEFQHKMEHGNIDLELRGRWRLRSQFVQDHGATLPPGVSIEQAGKSLALRVRTTPIQLNRPFHDQYNAVKEALIKASEMLEWMESRSDLLEYGIG